MRQLDEELYKPLHEYGEGELADLIRELEHVRWAENERYIREAAHTFAEKWRNTRVSGISPGFPITIQLAAPTWHMREQLWKEGAGLAYKQATFVNIRLSLPSWVPEDYVEPLAECMIRQQLEAYLGAY